MAGKSSCKKPRRETGAFYARRKQWELIKVVCVVEPSIDGEYLNDAEYGLLMRLGADIQYALEQAADVSAEARKTIGERVQAAAAEKEKRGI